MEQFRAECPNCGDKLILRSLGCPGCGLELNGEIEVPRLLRLSPEEREFIELFVLSGGSLKEVGQWLGISYPTVRIKLNQVIQKLQSLSGLEQKERLEILTKVEKGEISAQEAVKYLKKENLSQFKIKPKD
jgi:hypothetical protein